MREVTTKTKVFTTALASIGLLIAGAVFHSDAFTLAGVAGFVLFLVLLAKAPTNRD